MIPSRQDRRTFLKGTGVTMALPWLEQMGVQTSWAAGNTPAARLHVLGQGIAEVLGLHR